MVSTLVLSTFSPTSSFLLLSWLGFPGGAGLERSPGRGNGSPLQYSSLENSTDCVVHGVEKSWTWLSDFYSVPVNSSSALLDTAKWSLASGAYPVLPQVEEPLPSLLPGSLCRRCCYSSSTLQLGLLMTCLSLPGCCGKSTAFCACRTCPST